MLVEDVCQRSGHLRTPSGLRSNLFHHLQTLRHVTDRHDPRDPLLSPDVSIYSKPTSLLRNSNSKS